MSKRLELMKTYLKTLGSINRFDASIFKACELVKAEPSKVVVRMKIGEEHSNSYSTLHGGCSATIIDVISTMNLIDERNEYKNTGVSTDITLQCLNPAKVGDIILIESETLKIGKNLAFLQVNIRNEENGKLLVKGLHTKFISK